MARSGLTVAFITLDMQSVEDVKSVLGDAWQNLYIIQTINIEEAFTDRKIDVVIFDEPFSDVDMTSIRKFKDHAPIIIITKTANPLLKNEQLVYSIKPAEFKTPVLQHVVQHLIENKALLEKLSSAKRELTDLATRDDLTQLYNKRYIDDIFAKELKKSLRYKTPVTLLLLGVDSLKNMNEAYGYETGNLILQEFAMLVQNAVREADIVARYNGDEFIVMLPETASHEAMVVAKRIKANIHDTTFVKGRLTHNPTASIGIAEHRAEFKTADEWSGAVRLALQEAKQSGRDQICTYEEAESSARPELTENTQIIRELKSQIHTITEDTKRSYFKEILNLLGEDPFYKKYISPHSERVAFFAEKLSSKIGMKMDEVLAIRRGALLHDVGKIAIDKKLLLKTDHLSGGEFNLLRQHPIIGLQIISANLFWKNELAMILHHHEWFDGRGYPDRLAGTNIPLGARILAIAESWDTMTTDQPYRPAMTLDSALAEISRNAGLQFDPELAETFVKMIEG